MTDNVHATGLSTTELIDIVDEHDNVIDSQSRSKELFDTKIVRCSQIFILNDDGDIILPQRLRTKCISPLRYDASVGGTNQSGMTQEETAIAELEEEMGITNTLLTYLGKIKAHDVDDGRLVSFVSVYLIHHNGPYSNWEREAERLETFSVDELAHLCRRFPYWFVPGFANSFDLVQDYLKHQKAA